MNEPIKYMFNISKHELYIYHGMAGHINMTVVSLSGFPMAIRLAKIHDVRHFSIMFDAPSQRREAHTKRDIAARVLGCDVPLIDATWPSLNDLETNLPTQPQSSDQEG